MLFLQIPRWILLSIIILFLLLKQKYFQTIDKNKKCVYNKDRKWVATDNVCYLKWLDKHHIARRS